MLLHYSRSKCLDLERNKGFAGDSRFKSQLRYFEGSASMHYFREMFSLFPESFRPERRKGFKAYDGTNNIFNLAYEMLSWKVHRALIKAKLEPYLGFLHSVQYGKPSLVCDFMERYRYLVDDFLIDYCRNLRPNDFIVKPENIGRKKLGKREYLNNKQARHLITRMDILFESNVEIPRIRVGKRQIVETLISEEAQLLAKFLRNELNVWIPRMAFHDLEGKIDYRKYS